MKQFMYFMLLGGLLVFSSCASTLNPRLQPVEVKTKSKDSKVYIDGEYIGKGKSVKTKIRRDATGKSVKIVREGYKNSYKTFTPEKKSPWSIMSFVPGLIVFAPLYDYGAKAYNYNPSVSAGTAVKIQKREENQRYIIIESAGMEIEQKGFRVVVGKKNGPQRPQESNDDRLKVDNTIFSIYIDSLLVKNNFRDTTDRILVNPSAHLFLNMEISKLYIYDEYRKWMPSRMITTPMYTVVKPEITWELSNIYGDVLYSKKMKVKSDEFLRVRYNFFEPDGPDSYSQAINDAIETSLNKFLQLVEVQKLLPLVLSKNVKFQTYTFEDPQSGELPIARALEAGVTILTENGHGSGFFISADGLVITNYNVVNGEKDIEIRTQSGEEYKATILRSNQEADLTLLKVKGVNFQALSIPSEKNYELGQEILAIGTPTGVDLGQTISSGIVSAERQLDHSDFNWIQTDVSVSPGSSGGPIVSSNGELVGISNGKLYGIGIEGLSFAIPAHEIWDILELEGLIK